MKSDLFRPTKRKLQPIQDLISSLRGSQNFKHEVDNQVKLQKRLIKTLQMPVLALYLVIIFAPVTIVEILTKRKIRLSEARQNLAVKEKQAKIYEKNILSLEADLDNLFELCNTHFAAMVTMLEELVAKDSSCQDGQMLLTQLRNHPPKDKLERLELFLSMESTWVRFR